MMNLTSQQPNSADLVDLQITISELSGIKPFWIRGFAAHRTFGELFQETMNHPSVVQSPQALDPPTASRHFWCGERFVSRNAAVTTLLSTATQTATGSREVSLTLRRDLYAVQPNTLVAGQTGYTYIDPEERIATVVAKIVTHTVPSCCYDLCDARRRKLSGEKSLTDYALWPGWEDAAMQDRSRLNLRHRTDFMAYALLAAIMIVGVIAGYWLWMRLLVPH
jgi:hypothetical protein